MKRMGKCIILGLSLILFLKGIGFAADITKADELFDKGTFQEALKEYELVFKETPDAETRWKAFFRACESLAHLFRYGEAAQKLITTPLPRKMPQRARILILKAGMFRNFLRQYSHIQRRDVIDEEEKEVFRLTPQEIKKEISRAYLELWGLRRGLVQMDMREEGYFLQIGNIDFGMYPTLFDYLVLGWTDSLRRGEARYLTRETARPMAELLLGAEFSRPVNVEDPAPLLVAEIMEEASRFNRRDRLEAAERWKIKRLLLPIKWGVYDFEDSPGYRNRARQILLGWMDTFQTREGKAEAGYEAAVILSSNNELFKAVKLCKKIERNFPATHTSRHARVLRSRIEMPQLTLQARTVTPPAPQAFTITTKNLREVYFRIYRLDPERLKDEIMYAKRSFYGWSNILSQPDQEWLKEYLPGIVTHRAWSAKTEDKGHYQRLTKTIDPPPLEAGIYLVLASGDRSFKIGSSLLRTCFLNVTDLVLVGTAGFSTETNEAYYDFIDNQGPARISDDVFRFYAFDAKSGRPVDGVELNIYLAPKREFFNLKADKKGFASLSLAVGVSPQAHNSYRVDPLAKNNKSFSYWRNSQSLYYSPPNPIVLFMETDRPIYRPGHKVQAKVVVVRRISQGFKTLGNNQSVRLSACGPNGKEFFSKSVKLSEFGSARVSFEIPGGRLLGRYTLNARCYDGRFSNSASVNFSVEEYKRPEFEILLKPADAPWKYEELVEIKGQATYYFGGPLPDAPIKYRIKRQTYIPWCYRYWFGQHYSSSAQEIATGELKTDSEGNFVIPFTPTPPSQRYGGKVPDIAQFSVEVEGRDSGGRTIETQQSYRAGKNAIYFIIEPQKGCYLEREDVEIESKRLTINDTPAQGVSSYQVFRLANTPTKPHRHRGYWGWIPPLDMQLKDVPNGRLVARGETEHDKDGRGLVKIVPLDQGAYRIVQQSRDRWGGEVKQEKILVVAKNFKEAVPVNAASLTLVEKDEYRIGEVARFVIGSGLATGIYHIELWAGRHLLRSEFIDGNCPVRLIEVPVTEGMKGGFTLRWFGVKGLNVHHGQATVSVPWKEKKLKVALKPFTEELKPGEEVTWGVRLKDAKGRPVAAEVLALMYDRSLEYYRKSQHPWLDNLYALRPAPDYGKDSVFDPYVRSLPISEGLLEKLLKAFRQPSPEPKLPGLRTRRTWADTRGFRRKLGRGRLLRKALPGEEMVMDAAAPMMEKEAKAGAGFKYQEAAKKVETRKEFADTAFFKPHIITAKDGSGRFTFTAPEQLSGWRVKVFAFTGDVKEGRLTEEAVTRKELMVRADLPRFFREKDRGTVTAMVHNESDGILEGELFIEITEKGKSINERLKLEDSKKSFRIKPHSLTTFNWMIEIPQGVSTYKVRLAAVTDRLSDAEERELPILPSRQRLVESVFVALAGSESKELKFSLKSDPTRINETMLLQIDPQLALSILNTLPFLVEYPYECVEQILNKYVPLSVVNEIYKKYPALREAVGKIPRRQTVTPSWEKEDPRRLITLMETPWVWQSEGRPTTWPIIDLLAPEIVKAQREITFAKLRAAQLSNGAFPWWPGGEADPYMTLYVLAGLAEARRYGVEVPRDMIQKALGYVNKEIPLKLKAEERYLALVSYAAYVVTSYPPEEFSEARKGHEAARSWVVFLERHIHAMTPLGKAYLAYTHLRLGDRDKAEGVLDMAMDGAREDAIAGVYWTPEKYSWVWYSDTVEKHAFFLRTLQELRPEDKRIPGMVQWLLFNRKGTVWKSTKASAAAVYALLDFLNQRGALASDERFKVEWGKDTYSVVVRAEDWLDEPLRWQEKGFEITPRKTSAIVEKEGPGLAFASLTWTYSTDQLPEASVPGMLEVKRTFYRRVKEKDAYHLKPLKSGEGVFVGDQIEVQLRINARSQFEYMHLKDPKAAGFEAETLLSGWKYDPLRFYEEPRDSLTNFFLSWLPHGEYVLRYRLRPTKPGTYRVGATTLQSMYSPDMTAHSAGFIIRVLE